MWGALDTLENLKKGGRIGGAKALLATALSIKPIIEVRDGKVEQGGKQRTRARRRSRSSSSKLGSYEGRIDNLAVLHADCSDVDQFVDMLRPHYAGEIVVGDIGPVIGTHAGRGTIGVRVPGPTAPDRPRRCSTALPGIGGRTTSVRRTDMSAAPPAPRRSRRSVLAHRYRLERRTRARRHGRGLARHRPRRSTAGRASSCSSRRSRPIRSWPSGSVARRSPSPS